MTSDVHQLSLNDNAKTALAILAQNRKVLFTQTGSDTAQPFVTLTMPLSEFNVLADKLLEILQ